jgi:hypothetical protein
METKWAKRSYKDLIRNWWKIFYLTKYNKISYNNNEPTIQDNGNFVINLYNC